MRRKNRDEPTGILKFSPKLSEPEKLEQRKLNSIELRVKSHKLIELNHGWEKAISYSQYSTYVKCPHQWKLSYVDRLNPYKDTIYTIFGTAMHETLQHYLTVMYERSAVHADAVIDLPVYFQERLMTLYRDAYDKTKTHFTDPEELRSFYEDGVNILRYFSRNRDKYFKNEGFKLVGVEIPILTNVKGNIYIKGFIDLVIYDENQDKIIIFDLKTSSRGWDKEKKDQLKIEQVLFYKEYFSKQYSWDVEKIDVQFLILKRKIYENAQFPIPRIQQFIPPSGKTKRTKAVENLERFISECFEKDGKHKVDKTYVKIVGMESCQYCPYCDKADLCDKNGNTSKKLKKIKI